MLQTNYSSWGADWRTAEINRLPADRIIDVSWFKRCRPSSKRKLARLKSGICVDNRFRVQ